MKKSIKYFIYALLLILFIGVSVVEAKTSGELNFCLYAGSRRAFMILGYIMLIVKILVPIILIFMCIVDVVKPVLTANPGDIIKAVPTIIRRLIAGFVVFLLPTIINGIFMLLVDTSNNSITECTACFEHPNQCNVQDGDGNDQKANKIYNDTSKK